MSSCLGDGKTEISNFRNLAQGVMKVELEEHAHLLFNREPHYLISKAF